MNSKCFLDFNRTDSSRPFSEKKKRVSLSIYESGQLIQVKPSEENDLKKSITAPQRRTTQLVLCRVLI